MLNADYQYQHKLRWLKRWIWVYFWLLIFEGALRKWILPQFSGPLLLVRDPVALIVYVQAFRCGKFSMKTMWPLAMFAVVLVLFAGAQVAWGSNTVPIALYGLRSYLLHLPLVVVIADTLDEEDIHKLGRWLLWLCIPLMILALAQYNAPSNSWLNAGAREGVSQIDSARGHIRPAGTFSFGLGMQILVVLVAAYIVDALMRKGIYPRWLLYPALFATVATIPLLGSRTVLFSMAILFIFVLFSGIGHAARLTSILKLVVILLLVSLVAIQLPAFNDAVDTMSERWQNASSTEGNVQEILEKRVFSSFENGITSSGEMPWLGVGIGMGSRYAALATTGEERFTVAEDEWVRVVPEFGAIFGLLFMGARAVFAAYLILRARHALSRNAVLAWLLVPVVVPLWVMGTMEQATVLGFMVFGAGLILAAARSTEIA